MVRGASLTNTKPPEREAPAASCCPGYGDQDDRFRAPPPCGRDGESAGRGASPKVPRPTPRNGGYSARVTSQYVLKLPWPRPPLSLNDRHANAYAERRVQTKAHTEVTLVASIALNAGRAKHFDRASVELVYYPGNNTRRDADNMAATLKPVLDGLVSAGLLDDDKANHVVRTSQRVVLRQDDPYGRKDPAVFLIVREVAASDDFPHVRPDGGL